MRSTPESGLRINNLALAETVYLFCDWSLKIYANAVPVPEIFKIRLMLSDMAVNGRAFTLNPYRPNEFNMSDNRRAAPMATGQHFEIDVERATAEDGALAYRLQSDVYAWFGFNTAEMPYVSREEQRPPRIEPAQLLSFQTTSDHGVRTFEINRFTKVWELTLFDYDGHFRGGFVFLRIHS
jgi:hypothetical protein